MAWVALLLGVGQVVLILTSWLLTAAMPENFPRSLLSAEGIRWFFGRFVGNVESPLLVWLLLFSFMLGALQYSGILHYRSSEYRQRIAMRLALFEGIFFLLLILALVLVPHAILLNVMGGIEASSFSRSILPYICFSVIVMSLSFGAVSNRLQGIEAMGESLSEGIQSAAPYFVIYILVNQLYSSIEYLFGI